MRAWLVCTHAEDFYPLEELTNEGDLQQSVELHVKHYGEEHREYIRVFFPEMPTHVLDETEYHWLDYYAHGNDSIWTEDTARVILDLYDNTIR